jgi:hypothetical protein
VLYGCWAVIALPLLVGGLVSSESALVITSLIVSAILLPLFFLVERAARLILTRDGVEVKQAGANLKSSWENILGLRLVRGSEGFVLRDPMSGRGVQRFASAAAVRMRGVSMYDEEVGQLIAQHRFIPIEAFAYWLRRGNLLEVIGQHAPQLLSNRAGAAEVPGLRPPPKLSRTRLTLIVAIIVLSMAAGALAALNEDIQPVIVRVGEVMIILALTGSAVSNVISWRWLCFSY